MADGRQENLESLNIVWEGGFRLAVQARSHGLIADQPEAEGGRDGGMTPIELLAASLGTCIGYFAARFFERHRISPSALKIAVQWDYAEGPHRISKFRTVVDVDAPLDAILRERFRKVLEGCTVHRTLQIPPEVTIELRRTGG